MKEVSFLQANFNWAKNVIFEEKSFWKQVRENTFTSDWSFFDRPIVARWKVKHKFNHYVETHLR